MAEPLVFDVRPADDPSLSFLSGSGPDGRLAEDEYDILKGFYGLDVDRTYGEDLAEAGQLYWRVIAFELKSGVAAFQPQVWKDGAKYIATPGDEANVAVAFHWPDAPELDAGWQPQYQNRAVIGWTEGHGDVGFGYSSSQAKEVERLSTLDLAPEYYPVQSTAIYATGATSLDGGPFWIWVMAGGGKIGSDAAIKLNWVDNHLTPNPILEATVKSGDTPLPGTEYLVNLAADGSITGRIPWTPGPPGGGAAALGYWRDGEVVAHIEWT